MGQEDLYQSDFYENKNRFADAFNGALFGGKDKKRMYEMLKKNILYKKMDKLTAEAIFEVLNVNVDMEKIIEIDETGREVYDMCKAFEDYKEEGRQEGRREGRQEGRKEVEIEIVDMIKNLMKNQEISFDTATELLGISKNKKKKLSTLF